MIFFEGGGVSGFNTFRLEGSGITVLAARNEKIRGSQIPRFQYFGLPSRILKVEHLSPWVRGVVGTRRKVWLVW